MQNWRESSNGQKFVNPYNFVALGGPVPRTNLEKPPEVGEENITGAIHCRLRTVTPLAIPDEETKVEVKPESGHFKYLIFKIGGMPVITGSELRGMIRSVYETVTNSCLSVVNTNILSARHSFPRMPGLIKYNEKTQEWELYKAQKFMINNEVPTDTEYSRKEMGQYYEIKRYGVEKWEIASPSVRGKKYVTGSEISFVPGANFETSKDYTLQTRVVSRVVESDDTLKSGESKKDGYLLLWECLPERPQHSSQEKHHNSIFTLSDPEELVECVNIDQAVIGFRELIKIYEEDDYRPKSKTQYERVSYELAMDGRFMPVWYETAINSQNETFVYLSPACISRTVFDNRLETLLGDHSTKNCVYNESEYALCPACELFGRIGGDKDQKALGGSLRFTDAFREKSEQSLGFKRLRVLSGPKPEAVEMYTKRPQGATTWTYDYKTTGYETRKVTVETTARGTTVTTIKGGETVTTETPAQIGVVGKTVTTSETIPIRLIEAPVLNGRKFYHHNLAVNKDESLYTSKDVESNQNSTMELIKPGQDFEFDIYFEDITALQLNQLLWVLTLGENPDKDKMDKAILCHKIGHGKPLGLGSVKIIAESVTIRTVSVSDSGVKYSNQVYGNETMDLTLPVMDNRFYWKEEELELLAQSYPFNQRADKETADKFKQLFGPFCKVEDIAEKIDMANKADASPKAKKSKKNANKNMSLSQFKVADIEIEPERKAVTIPVYMFDLLRMFNIHTTDGLYVSYPLGDDGKNDPKKSQASYNWFTGNRQLGKLADNSNATGVKHSIKHTLAALTEVNDGEMTRPDLRLPKIEG